jgi:uncharacterized protein (DUF2345 family)
MASDGISSADTDTNTDIYANANTDIHANTNTDIHANANTDIHANTNTNLHANAYTDSSSCTPDSHCRQHGDGLRAGRHLRDG